VLIRPAVVDDLDAIAAIYDHQVATTVATFDLEPQGPDLWAPRVGSVAAGDHLLVAEEVGRVVGYAYSSAFRPRPAYLHTRETSVYLADDARGRGVGRALYDDLLERLVADGVHTAVATVALPNPASDALHRACGYREVGVLREVGRKLGRWVDVRWWQKDFAPDRTVWLT
jgi:L-amino acid N-acyltransferase YncA